MNRHHRQERQESACLQHAEHIPEIGTCRHLDVFHNVAEDFTSFMHTVFEHHQIFFEQDDVSAFFGNIHSSINRNTDVRLPQCRSVVDTVALKTNRMTLFLQQRNDAGFLHGLNLAKIFTLPMRVFSSSSVNASISLPFNEI